MSDSTSDSRTFVVLFAVSAAGSLLLTTLEWSLGEYLEASFYLAVAGAWTVLAMDHLLWTNKRKPFLAHVVLGAAIAWLLVVGFVTFA